MVIATTAFSITSYAVEYPSNVTGLTVTIDEVSISPFILESAVAFQDDIEAETNAMLITVSSIVTFRVLCSYDDTSGGLVAGNLVVNISHPAVNVSTLTNNGRRLEMISCSGGDGVNAYIMNPASQAQASSNVQIWVTRLNQRPNFGAFVTCKLIYTFRGTGAQAAAGYQALLANTPSIAVTYRSGELSVQSLESMLPDMHRIYMGLLDPSTGWLPTMNTNLQTLVTGNITTNSWLNTISGQTQVTNSHLSDVKTNQVQQIGQLQQIVDYVNSTVAANAVDDAKTDFGNNAASLESGQAALEGRADTAFDAVDTDTSIIVRYQTSTNFWLRCIAALPNAIGSIWDVIGFALLFAFVLFILKLAR